MITANPLVSIVVLLVTAGFIAWCIYQVWKKQAFGLVGMNIVIVAVVVLIFRYAFPAFTNTVLYKSLYLNIFNVVPLVVAGLIGWHAFQLWESGRRQSMAIIHGILAAVIGLGGPIMLEYTTNWKLAQVYSPKAHSGMLVVDESALRYTPRQVAYTEMRGTFGSSQLTVELHLTDAIDLNGGFGYIVPASPESGWPTIWEETDGFVMYDDNPLVGDGNRINRVIDVQTYGEEMQVLDNLHRQLYWNDFWAEYNEVIYLQLNPEDDEDITVVVPRIRYRIEWPLVFVPYLDGVFLMDSDGKFEDLSQAEMLKDERLQNRPIVPSSFIRRVAESQVFQPGYFCGYFRCAGKIQVPDLPGYSQLPFLVKAADGRHYKIVVTEPDGNSESIFKVFVWDAFTGELSQIDFGEDSNMLGPVTALERVKQIPGYKWVERTGGDEIGNFRVIEPVFLPLPVGDTWRVFWKFSITTKEYLGVSETVVIDSVSRRFLRFKSRGEYERWVALPPNQRVIDSSASSLPAGVSDAMSSGDLAEARRLLIQALQILERIEAENSSPQ